MGEGEGIGDGLGFTGCDGEGAGVGVKVVAGDGVSVAVSEGVGLGVAVWRLQSHSSRIAAIEVLSLQKSRKGRSEEQFISGRALAKGLLGSASIEAGSTAGFKQAEQRDCPFVSLPEKSRGRWGTGITPAVMPRCQWVRPVLIAQVKFTEWTHDDRLRRPVFLGLRTDKEAKDVVRE
jgi:hypothetical protein